MQDRKKGFYEYLSDWKKAMENVGPLLKETGDLDTWDSEKVEVLNASVFTCKTNPQESQVPEARLKGWSKEDVSLVEEDKVR